MELDFPSSHFPWGLKFLPQFQATELIFPGHFLVLWKGIALLPISGFPESLAFTNSVAWPLSPLSLRHITAVTLLSVSLTVKQAGRHLRIDLRRELGEKVAAGPCVPTLRLNTEQVLSTVSHCSLSPAPVKSKFAPHLESQTAENVNALALISEA